MSILIALAICSCTQNKSIRISGQFVGKINDTDTIVVTNTETKISYKLAVDEQGQFDEQVEAQPGYYRLNSKQVLPGIALYLPPNASVNYTINLENWRKEKNFTTQGNPETDYLKLFDESNTQFYRKHNYRLRQLSPQVFKKAIDSLYNSQLDFLDHFAAENNIKDGEFITIEKQRILYNRAESNESYAVRRTKGFLPNNFFDFRKELDYNNERLLLISGTDYATAATRYILNETQSTLPEGGDEVIHTINTCAARITNAKVKSHILRSLTAPYLTSSANYEEAYSLFTKNCTDERTLSAVTKIHEKHQKLKPGMPSPKFTTYEDTKGGKVALDDFKGKYLYIDIWATWCTPCKREIPALKALEEKYHDKNITFMSISIDTDKTKEAWKKMVVDMELTGVQIISDKSSDSQFMQDYDASSVPRFIILDTEGNIVNAKAPRPSDPEIENIFNKLLE